MFQSFLRSKIHRATVTDANLNYEGSITLGKELIAAANFRNYEKVEIYNINNGERFETYVIPGDASPTEVCLNGAAARKVAIGDKVIICSYALYENNETIQKPYIVKIINENNQFQSYRGD